MAGNYLDLAVYQKAFNLALVIFKLSENFDKSEKYSLTDQMRRSSRSVCANLVEAYRKRQYESHFICKYLMQMVRIRKRKSGLTLP